jgi:hypothetical protein
MPTTTPAPAPLPPPPPPAMTPLALAALENGVSFEDVRAYLASRANGRT